MPLVLETLHLELPALIIHGGAGNYVSTHTPKQLLERAESLRGILHMAYAALAEPGGGGARGGVLASLEGLELDPRFNAGRGGALQRDGQVRVSAALMDGARTRGAAIYNAPGCLHASKLCDALLDRVDTPLVGERFLDGQGAAALMQELGIATEDLVTPRQRALHEKRLSWLADPNSHPDVNVAEEHAAVGTSDSRDGAGGRSAGNTDGADGIPDDAPLTDGAGGVEVPAAAASPARPSRNPRLADEDNRHGTVGAVAVDADGRLFAGTSTGGRGFEVPGRVSDTPTPAGNSATPEVAISATGIGEFIVDINLCGRITARVADGMALEKAAKKTLREAERLAFGTTRDGAARGSNMGLIAIAPDGEAVVVYTTEAMGTAARGASGDLWVDLHSRPPTA